MGTALPQDPNSVGCSQAGTTPSLGVHRRSQIRSLLPEIPWGRGFWALRYALGRQREWWDVQFSNGQNCTGQVDQSNRYHDNQICSKQRDKSERGILKGEEAAITLLIYPCVLKEWLFLWNSASSDPEQCHCRSAIRVVQSWDVAWRFCEFQKLLFDD